MLKPFMLSILANNSFPDCNNLWLLTLQLACNLLLLMQLIDGERLLVQLTLKKPESKPLALLEHFSAQMELKMLATAVIPRSQPRDN